MLCISSLICEILLGSEQLQILYEENLENDMYTC